MSAYDPKPTSERVTGQLTMVVAAQHSLCGKYLRLGQYRYREMFAEISGIASVR
jgi:hypothetical protein